MSKIKRVISELILRENFAPSILSLFYNPYYLARRSLAKSIKNGVSDLSSGGVILDVGCGSKPYRGWFPCRNYIGIDIENPGHSHKLEEIDVLYDGLTLPFADNLFDNIICFQVLEHVFTPDIFLREIHRVLKPGGKMILTVPFVWNEHELPQDFARYTSFGLNYLLVKHGFCLIRSVKLTTGLSAIFQMTNALVAASCKKSFLKFVLPLFYFINNMLGTFFSKLSSEESSFYLDNIVIVQKGEDT